MNQCKAVAPALIGYKHVSGGGVPGGHNVLWDGVRKPFITPMTECNSIPLRYSDVVVDVGAYVGTYAIRCARFPVQRVVAYEPTPATFEVLSLTRLPNLELVNGAVVGDDRTQVELHVSAGIGVTNSLVLTSRKARVVTVPAIPYEVAVAGASVVKIDVEGAEYGFDVVQPSIRALIIDFHPLPHQDWIGMAEAMIVKILAAGFEPVISPKWGNGWTRAGSWIRDLPTEGEFEPMMAGQVCCGCGAEIVQEETWADRTLCDPCWSSWSPKHRAGYRRAA